jgi:hypothetical protein
MITHISERVIASVFGDHWLDKKSALRANYGLPPAKEGRMQVSTILCRAGLVLSLVVLLANPSPALRASAAAAWYVAPEGADTNNCAQPATPCATINGALGQASPGDTLYVAAGTYTSDDGPVVLLSKNATLSGGWDAGFT